MGAVRSRCGADVSARTAVVRIRHDGGACPGTFESPLGAVVHARSVNARTNLIGTSLVTSVAAGPAVVEVVGEIGAGVAPAGTTETSGVAVASLAGGEAGVLLLLVGAMAEVFARVPSGGPGCVQAQRAEDGPGQGGSEEPERLAAGNGLVERLGEFIE